jgi:hypothetical protein
MDNLAVLFTPFGIAIVAIAGGILSGIIATLSKHRVRELEIRERIAMIEHGLVPAPERDPEGFEQQMRVVDHVQQRLNTAPRFRSGGIMVMSVGFGLMTLLWFVGVEREAIGVGGFLVMIGLGMLVNSVFAGHTPSPQPKQPPSSTAEGAQSSDTQRPS